MKSLIYIGATVGGIAGAYIPTIWGDNSMFSAWSILTGALGGFVGIYIGYKLQDYIDN